MFTFRILTSSSLGFFVHNAGRHKRHQYFASGLGICTVDMGAIQWSTHEDVQCGFFTPTTTFNAVFRDFSILDAYFISLILKCIAFYFGDLGNWHIQCTDCMLYLLILKINKCVMKPPWCTFTHQGHSNGTKSARQMPWLGRIMITKQNRQNEADYLP